MKAKEPSDVLFFFSLSINIALTNCLVIHIFFLQIHATGFLSLKMFMWDHNNTRNQNIHKSWNFDTDLKQIFAIKAN